MRPLRFLPVAAIAWCLYGCAQQAVTPATPPQAPKGEVAQSTTSANGAKAPTEPAMPSKGEKSAAEPAADLKIPEALKHEGYAYFGLGYDKPIDYVMTVSSKKETSTGSMQVTLLGVKDGVAKFKVERTGAIAEQLGASDTVECDATGVYTSETAMGKLKERHLELPAIVSPGTTWNAKTEIDMNTGQSVSEEESCRAVRVEKVKTKRGEQEALLTTANGTMKLSGQEMRTSVKTWFVKNKGMVKAELVTENGGVKETIVFEEAGGSK